jgi:hypothetical protein
MSDEPPRDRKDSRRDGGGAQERQADAQQQRAAERIAQARDPVAGEASVEQFHGGNRRTRREHGCPGEGDAAALGECRLTPAEAVRRPNLAALTQAPRDEHHPDKQSKPRENLARSVTYVIKGVVPEGDVADDVNCEVRESGRSRNGSHKECDQQTGDRAHVAVVRSRIG